MSNAQQNTSQDIFNFDNLGDLVRTVGDCIDGKTNIKIDTNLLSNLTKDLTANIQSSVNETIRKHTENLSKSSEEVPNTVPKQTNDVESNENKPDKTVPKATVFTHTSTFTTNTVNGCDKSNDNGTSNTNTSNTNTNIMDDESGLFLPNVLKYTVNNDEPLFRIYRFILPNIFKNDSIRVEINEQVKKRLGIHFINNTNIDAEFSRHISYRFHIDDVTQINLKSVVSYIDYDNEYIYVKFLKYNTNKIDNIKEIKVIYSVNQTSNANIFDS